MGGIASAVIGRESTNEKLLRESASIISGFGDSLLEVICRDACDGLNVNRVSCYTLVFVTLPSLVNDDR